MLLQVAVDDLIDLSSRKLGQSPFPVLAAWSVTLLLPGLDILFEFALRVRSARRVLHASSSPLIILLFGWDLSPLHFTFSLEHDLVADRSGTNRKLSQPILRQFPCYDFWFWV